MWKLKYWNTVTESLISSGTKTLYVVFVRAKSSMHMLAEFDAPCLIRENVLKIWILALRWMTEILLQHSKAEE